MRTVAVIPVRGREPLLKYTIRRLYEKNGLYHVICLGDSEKEQQVCENEGAEFIYHENNPVSKKWVSGFKRAKEFKPDAVLFVGSGDWVSDNWMGFVEPYLVKYDLIGKPDFNLLDIGTTGYRTCKWHGYRQAERRNEPIGIGRVISGRILGEMRWMPFDDRIDSGIDWSMYLNVQRRGGKVKMLCTEEIQSLSISTYRWPNMHKFEDHWRQKLKSEKLLGDKQTELLNLFPEYKEIFK